MTDSTPSAAEDLAERVRAGELRFHELEDHTDADTATAARRLLVEEQSDASLDVVGDYGFPAERADPNIENMVGAVQVPMGVAGPVRIRGGRLDGERYLPLPRRRAHCWPASTAAVPF